MRKLRFPHGRIESGGNRREGREGNQGDPNNER